MYDVLMTQRAWLAYQRADAVLARKLNRCIDNISLNPRTHPNIKRLSGTLSGQWRYRVGEWRVIYRVDEGAGQVIVLAICHRRDAYR